MVQAADVSTAHELRKDYVLPTGPAWSGDILTAHDGQLSPHAFYVHQDPHVTLDRHYHDAAEFQVVVAGGGSLGHHAVRPFSVHYAAYQTMYGPLVAGPDGLDYITLRLHYQRGLFYWPQERARMVRGARWQTMADASSLDPSALLVLAAPETEALIPAGEGGLAAWLMQVPPGGRAGVPSAPNGAGRFMLVVEGGARTATATLSRLSVAWIGTADCPLTAGPAGAAALVLQMPRDAGPLP